MIKYLWNKYLFVPSYLIGYEVSIRIVPAMEKILASKRCLGLSYFIDPPLLKLEDFIEKNFSIK